MSSALKDHKAKICMTHHLEVPYVVFCCFLRWWFFVYSISSSVFLINRLFHQMENTFHASFRGSTLRVLRAETRLTVYQSSYWGSRMLGSFKEAYAEPQNENKAYCFCLRARCFTNRGMAEKKTHLRTPYAGVPKLHVIRMSHLGWKPATQTHITKASMCALPK